MSFDLKRLSDPFPAGDIEWRVSQAGYGDRKEIWCKVLAYITARAIANRLDDVVGPENWCNTPMVVHEVRTGIWALQVGISIRIEGEWITKYDVSESTRVEPAKGGFSGAMKRAGSQWGIGRYLYLMDETYAEVSDQGGKGWKRARLDEKKGGDLYYWKPPRLPAWALPAVMNGESPITEADLNGLKKQWHKKLCPNETNRQELQTGFAQFARSVAGDFPVDAVTCWTKTMYDQCVKKLESIKAGGGAAADVPFE